jgi:hypothetical protein
MYIKKNLPFVELFGERLTIKLEKCAYEPKRYKKPKGMLLHTSGFCMCCITERCFSGAATKRWILQHPCTMKQVLAQKGGFQNKCINSSSCFTTASLQSRIVTKRQYYYIIADQNKLIANEYVQVTENMLGQVF